MITPAELAQFFERNLGIIEQQVKGLTHEQCLLQLPFRGNCMNWVLGHIADNRSGVCEALGQGAVMTPEEAKRYSYGSEPICGEGPGVLPLARLMEILRESQKRINVALPLLKERDWKRPMKDFRGEVTFGNHLVFLYFHDTYHIGQTEALRQLAGTNDGVI